MVTPRATVIFEASKQPGVWRKPTNDEFGAGRALRRTTVPTGKADVQAPEPVPLAMVQLIPAGWEVTCPLPPPPGMTETNPFAKRNGVHTVMIPYVVIPPAVPMMSDD